MIGLVIGVSCLIAGCIIGFLMGYEHWAYLIVKKPQKEKMRLIDAEIALNFYADRSRYYHRDNNCPAVCSDEGDKARAYLVKFKCKVE